MDQCSTNSARAFESQITVVLSAKASCINPGSNHPKAANKTSVSGSEDVPVQNGKAIFSIEGTATFQPDCTPPMTVVLCGSLGATSSIFDAQAPVLDGRQALRVDHPGHGDIYSLCAGWSAGMTGGGSPQPPERFVPEPTVESKL